MRRPKLVFASAVAAMVVSNPSWSAPQTVILAVSNMTCSVCPLTIKKALQKVPGVRKVEVSYERKEAQVTFETTKATIAKLEDATFDAGYPSKLRAIKK